MLKLYYEHFKKPYAYREVLREKETDGEVTEKGKTTDKIRPNQQQKPGDIYRSKISPETA
jgi:hypothetical protein